MQEQHKIHTICTLKRKDTKKALTELTISA